MSTGIFTLAEQLQGLNRNLHNQRRDRVSNTKLRAALETSVGEFRQARRLSGPETEAIFSGRPLVGVDGSVNQVGGNYPYTVHLFKSLAKSTMPGRNGETAVERVEMISPLLPDNLREIRNFLEERRHEIRVNEGLDDTERVNDLAEQQAYFMLADQRMVEMELKVAMEAIERFSPHLVLMDGGFSRLKGKGGELWDQFEDLALTMGSVVVGVIEEVGSYRLQSRLGEDVLNGFVHRHDREILFGTLNQGEWLKTSLDRPIKNEFYTVFTRLSDLPQAGACDFLREQADAVEDVIDFIYTITPNKSRGIPLWLDVVDAEVRLTKKQIDLIVKTNVDVENIESFLRPQRDRRDF
ncbi:DNA double-strand break repair nuclease NurA [Tumebacillus sp. ITR2]|uniref:DNA double-strand break repair nuclease NurA n=1 Tax=Tumebacillus amylolyticus TaxID=2801339 RepID=A0ABS1J7S6_9BACL|nr:DNA double-strand break repair nuclease NurA [Tumebacillus amylolyticus]MBL0386318.1 DNA double-strand break repair nuclease NurA [Tumebacillus amylolyticus]